MIDLRGLNSGRVAEPFENIEQVAKATIMAQAGNGRVVVQRASQLTEWQSAQLTAMVGMPAESFRDMIGARIQAILDLLTARLHREVDKIPPTALAVNIGILSDKWRDFRGIAQPSVVNQTNIQINGVDRLSALAMVTNQRSDMKGANTFLLTPKKDPSPARVEPAPPAPEPGIALEAPNVTETESGNTLPDAK